MQWLEIKRIEEAALVSARGIAALPFLLLFYALVLNSALSWPVSTAFVVFFAFSVVRPIPALKILAVLGPFVTPLAWGLAPALRWSEALTVTFLAAALLRAVISRERIRFNRPLLPFIAAQVFVAIAIASWVIELAVLQRGTDFAWPFARTLWHQFTSDFFKDPGIFIRVNQAVLIFEGIALFLCTQSLSCADPTLPRSLLRMAAIGAVGSAAFNVRRLFEIVARQGIRNFLALAPSLRFNVSQGDLNAAGSYFAMTLPLSIAFAAERKKALGWIGAGFLIFSALWLAGSRVAMASAAVAVIWLVWAGVVIAQGRHTRRAGRHILIGALLVIGLAALAVPTRRNIAAASALDVRTDMARVAIRLFETRPIFGIGVGTFWTRSSELIPDRLKPFYTHENAHNNFLQILAELGSLGLVSFLTLLVLVLQPFRRINASDTVVLGSLAGVFAFLLSCLGGHPLLTREVVYPFWIIIGALSVIRNQPAGSNPAAPVPPSRVHSLRLGVTMGVVILAATIPFRIQREFADRDFENVAIGLSMWQTSEDGVRYRWADMRARVFVPRSVSSVLLPLRLGATSHGPAMVSLRLDGRLANRVEVTDDRWTMVRLLMPPAGGRGRYRLIELTIETLEPRSSPPGSSAARAGLMVGRFELS